MPKTIQSFIFDRDTNRITPSYASKNSKPLKILIPKNKQLIVKNKITIKVKSKMANKSFNKNYDLAFEDHSTPDPDWHPTCPSQTGTVWGTFQANEKVDPTIADFDLGLFDHLDSPNQNMGDLEKNEPTNEKIHHVIVDAKKSEVVSDMRLRTWEVDKLSPTFEAYRGNGILGRIGTKYEGLVQIWNFQFC